MCHVPSVVNDLWSQIYATKAIASFYRDDSETVFPGLLTIYIPLLYLPTFSESNAWDFHLVMNEISGNVPPTSEDFRRIYEERCQNLNVCRLFPKTFKNFRSYLKDDTFSVLWYDFVRTQKRTQSHHVLRTICPDLWVRREKLSLMRGIDDFSPHAGVRLTHNAYTIFWWYEFWLA